MKILIFNWRDLKHSWAGGGEIYIFEMARRWVRAGHKVTVFCSRDIEKNLPSEEKYMGIKIIRKGGRFSLYLWAIWEYVTKFRGKFDLVVDVENGIPFFTPIFVRKPKVSIVYHIHARQFFYELNFPLNYIGYYIEKYVFPGLYKRIPIIAISKTTKRQLEKLGFNRSKVHVVYCGINGTEEYANSFKKFSYPTLLYLGRIKAYKRVDLLVRLFGDILKKIPQAKLIIAGWGTEASFITDMVMKSKYRRRIELFGPVSEAEKRRLLTRSWLFVNPSIGEGWSIAVIESNKYGTPAISFRVPGLSESIKHGITGVLAENEKELTEKIIEVLENKTYRQKISLKAKLWAANFSWQDSSEKALKLIEEIAKK